MSTYRPDSRQLCRSNMIISRLLPVAFAAVMVSQAHASILNWTNVVGGSASTAGNWSPSQVPVAGDDLAFNLLNTYNVTFRAAIATSHTQVYKRGAVTLLVTSPHTVTAGMTIGDVSGDNAVTHLGSGDLTSNSSITIADNSGSTGTLTIDGSDAALVLTGAATDLSVGRGGVGSLDVTAGGSVEVSDDLIIGAIVSGNGDVLISGGSGSIPNLNPSEIHTTSATSGDVFVGNIGSGALHLISGGQLHSAHDVRIGITAGETGAIDLSGVFSFLGSHLTVDRNLDIGRNDAITACGTASVTVNTSTSVNVLGATPIGDASGGDAALNMAGGNFTSATAIDLQTNGAITGNGTINADINCNGGDIQPATASGLVINGTIFNTTSNHILGTRIDFGSTGGYEGSGTCQADIAGSNGSHITATGTLSIGGNTTAGYSYNGALDVGGSIVTLLDTNGAVLGGTTTLNSGRIECPAGIGVANGGKITGDGLLVGKLTTAGIIDPDTTNPSTGGLITVQGDLQVNPTGIFDIKIGGTPGSGNYDRVVVSGTAAFGGTMRVTLENGFIPHTGMQYIACNAVGGRTGTFDNIIPAASCNGITMVMVYSSTAAIILIRPPDADVTRDGHIDVDDLLGVINNWNPAGGSGTPADVNGFNNIDVDDLLYVISRWGQCP